MMKNISIYEQEHTQQSLVTSIKFVRELVISAQQAEQIWAGYMKKFFLLTRPRGSSTLYVYVGIMGVCLLRFKIHRMFQIYLKV